jgi:selenocysteine lyase/cysteine desulfurase
MGPYSTGMAYYGECFHHGRPIEESWMNRTNAKEFGDLTNYGKFYTPEAGRFNVGQTSNFILTPMLSEAVRQVNEWGSELISSHARTLCAPVYDYMKSEGSKLDLKFQSSHILGIPKPRGMSDNELNQRLASKKISVSKRGAFLRISPHLYNDHDDINALMSCLS